MQLSRIIFSSIFTCIFFVRLSFAVVLDSKELLTMLDKLEVSTDCSSPKYSRKDWIHWQRDEKGGFNTRHKVLKEESLIAPMTKVGGNKIVKGRWYGAYTDQLFSNPKDLDIDHLVPLGEVHKSGGCHWSKEKKKKYANYLEHEEELIAVFKKANRSKGSRDPSKWLPSNEDYLCEYVSNWLVVKDRWKLWIDIKEKEAIVGVIEKHCENSELEYCLAQ